MTKEFPEILDYTDGVGDVAEVWATDLFNLRGDHFNIEAVCPDYLPESQCWATWRRDEQGVAIVSGYDPDNDWVCPWDDEENEIRYYDPDNYGPYIDDLDEEG